MRFGWGLVAFCALLAPISADMLPRAVRRPGAGPYFRIHRGKVWGFMDDKGNTVIAPQFEEEGDFFAGRARVRKGDYWGYIDENGKLSIPYRFYRAGDFVEGLAPVQLGRHGWGVIDPSGEFVVQPHLGAIAEFSDGLARFEDWDQIECNEFQGTKTYTKADAPEFAFFLDDGSNDDLGMIACRGGKFGYLDHEGKIVIPAQFELAFDFSDDRAVIRRLKNGYLAYGYIDRSGSIVVEPKLDYAAPFSEGLSVVTVTWDGPEKTGVMDKNGTSVIPPRFKSIRPFSEDVASACLDDDHWGFIDHSGKFVIPPRFESAQQFSEGVALVWSPNGPPPFYIDHTGKTALKLAWTAWPFSGGLTVMSFGDRYAYVDRSGKIVGTYERSRK